MRISDWSSDVCSSDLRKAVAQRTQNDAAKNIDDQNQYARNGIALHEFRRTVHGAVEIRLSRHFLTTRLGLFRCHEPSVQIGVDRHLLARQSIKGEASRHFGHTPGALGDDHQVDDHTDGTNEDAHNINAAYPDISETVQAAPPRRGANRSEQTRGE